MPETPDPETCTHDWRKEPYAGLVIYYTCAKCGAEDERDVS
jgi:hypothetical protein